jgi:endonuclease G
MKIKLIFLLFFSLFSLITLSAGNPHPELPAIQPNDQIVRHYAYTLSYVEEYEQAEWVAYMICRGRAVSSEERTNKFLVDELVTTGSATSKDYSKSGYDRGHLAPAADMGWSAQAMRESFYFSNMSPQLPSFNRGIWKKMEEKVRDWALEYDTLYVVTGPVLKKGLPAIGPNQVAVPEQYYKVILDCYPKFRCIAILMNNEAGNLPLKTYVTTIDSVEKLTGIDFFPWLPDEVELRIEATAKVEGWKW